MDASPLATDKYKMATATAGFPLRRETFVFLRKGGPWLMPVDGEALVRSIVPRVPDDDPELLAYMAATAWSCPMPTGRPRRRARDPLGPQGHLDPRRAPILTVTGPSALVSHLGHASSESWRSDSRSAPSAPRPRHPVGPPRRRHLRRRTRPRPRHPRGCRRGHWPSPSTPLATSPTSARGPRACSRPSRATPAASWRPATGQRRASASTSWPSRPPATPASAPRPTSWPPGCST